MLWDKNVLSEEVLSDKFFQVPPQASIVGSLISLTVMVRAKICRSGECMVILDQLWVSYWLLVLNVTEDFVDGEPQQGEVLFHSEGSEWIRGENREHQLLEGRLPPILVACMGRSLALQVYFLSVIAMFERVVNWTLYSLLQLNIRLASLISVMPCFNRCLYKG